jgi:NADPH:quinone reductase-like Zn-dependent oxidoreductase
VQLAKAAGAHVIATASPQTIERVTSAGADEIIDYTTTTVLEAVTEQVDVLVNLAPIDPAQFAALVSLVRSGGVVVSTTVWMPAPSDEARGVRAVDLYVRSDPEQLKELVARIDRGELTVNVAEHVPLADLASVHVRATAGTLAGKVVIVVAHS